MKSSEIRDKYLRFFESKGHKILPGSSLVPEDPTVLLTLAGMLQFKPVFLGQEKPKHKRAATVQKCIRTNDIDQVGKTSRHQTFFEMLGNFSFGDYFKREAIAFAWKLMTEVFQIDPARLSIAIYEKDDEAFDIWNKEIGLAKEKIFRLDEDNNFWAAGPTGPCGPCSEIYYDMGQEHGCGKPGCQPGCDCDRFLEVWNLVFIQYDRNAKGELIPLKQKGIDTGMGLERIASVLQGVDSNFKTDLFIPLIDKIKTLTKQQVLSSVSLNIVADHVRAAANLIADGVAPENVGRGYILRRLIRRAIHHGILLGINGPFLSLLSQEVVQDMGSVYAVLKQKEKLIQEVIKTEEQHFLSTLEMGLQLFKQVVAESQKNKVIPGEKAFKLHDTYGFPIELTKEMAAEQGLNVDDAGFEKCMEEQKEKGRSAGVAGDKQALAHLNLEGISQTKFEGYEKTEIETKVAAVFPEQKFVVLEKTPFYPEQGGQAGDSGILRLKEKEVKVLDALTTAQGIIVHKVEDASSFKVKDKVIAVIDLAKRQATALHHTATHLLHKALQEVLGGHAKQAGSYVGPDKLRFDFTHFSAMKPDEILTVEKIVNQKIKQGLKVETLQKSYDEALQMGATALFGEKYGDKVRVLKIGDYSLELCGGTHAKACKDILFFKIISEGAVGSGIRRIEALAGETAKAYLVHQAKSLREEVHELVRKYKMQQLIIESLGGKQFTETDIFEIEVTELERIGHCIDGQDVENVDKFFAHFKGRIDWMKERISKAEKEINSLRLKNIQSEALSFAAEIKEKNSVKILLKEFSEYSIEMLRTISDVVQNQVKSCVIVLASVVNGKVRFLITVTPDLIPKGCSAKKIADVFGAVVGGKGGGKDLKVEGGANDPSKIQEAFSKVWDTCV